jgi:hypothetical protein
MKKYRDILWDGPKTQENFEKEMEEDKENDDKIDSKSSVKDS